MEMKICPNCDEQNLAMAWKCKKCSYDLSSVGLSEINVLYPNLPELISPNFL